MMGEIKHKGDGGRVGHPTPPNKSLHHHSLHAALYAFGALRFAPSNQPAPLAPPLATSTQHTLTHTSPSHPPSPEAKAKGKQRRGKMVTMPHPNKDEVKAKVEEQMAKVLIMYLNVCVWVMFGWVGCVDVSI
jgi:hypothetical protein